MSSQVLPLNKMHLHSPSSGDRSRAQNNIEEKTWFAQNGYVLPMFTTDVSEDGQSGVHETIYIPVLTSLPSGYVENSSGELTDPNLSTSGDWSSAPIAHKAKSSANYAAIKPHNSNVCKSSSVNINADDEENTHIQIWQGSEGIRDKDERRASPGYVVFPTKTNYEAFLTADFTTQTSHGLRKNCARDEQEKSSGCKAFPVANFIIQTSNSLGENSVRDEQGKSSGYIAYPATNFDMQTSSGLGENSTKDEQGNSSDYITFPAANFIMQTSNGLVEDSVRVQQGKSSGYISFPAANFIMQTSNGLVEDSVRDEQGKSSGYIAFPAANFDMQASSGLGENSAKDEQGKSSGYISFPGANLVMRTFSGLGENSVRDEQEKSRGYVYFPPIDFREIPIKNSPFPGYVALPPVGCGPHNPQSSIGPGQINRLEAESKTRSKQEANKRDISIKTGAYVAMDSLKLQNLKGETDPNLS